MKIGKYPVKRTYKIAQLICDILSLGFVVMIVSLTIGFIDEYQELLAALGAEHIANIAQTKDATIEWRHWLSLICPLLAVAVIAVYIVLILKSHKFSRYSVTKLTAQKCYETYAFFVSICKLPLLIIIIDYTMIIHDKLRLAPLYDFGWFSATSLLYLLILAIIIRYGMHRISKITEKSAPTTSDSIKVRAVVKKESDENKEEI